MATITQGAKGMGAYLREFGAAMLAYTVILPLSIHFVAANPQTVWRVPVARARGARPGGFCSLGSDPPGAADGRVATADAVRGAGVRL